MMNCDQVFDILTRGPFPTGDMSDIDVEMHLQNCAECRRLAEALRPVVEMFKESIEPHEGEDLPGYWGLLAEELQEAPRLESSATEPTNRLVSLAARRDRPTRGRTTEVRQQAEHQAFNRNVFRLMLAVVVGVAIGALLRVAGVAGPNEQHDDQAVAESTIRSSRPAISPAKSSPVTVVAQASLSPLGLFKELGMHHACLVEPRSIGTSLTTPTTNEAELTVSEQIPAIEHIVNVRCCTHCHHAESSPAAAPQVSALKVVMSCSTCHVESLP